jgi:hypothetical protein
MSHVFAHESAHAVAAVQRGIAIQEVRVLRPADWLARGGSGGSMAGGVWLVEEDPTAWIPHDPVAAMEFVLAGSLAEEAMYGHYLPNGYEGDFAIWRRGVGLTAPTSQDEVDRALGRPLPEVVGGVRSWLRDAFPAIKRTILALAQLQESTANLAVVPYRDDWRLSEDQVRAIVEA